MRRDPVENIHYESIAFQSPFHGLVLWEVALAFTEGPHLKPLWESAIVLAQKGGRRLCPVLPPGSPSKSSKYLFTEDLVVLYSLTRCVYLSSFSLWLPGNSKPLTFNYRDDRPFGLQSYILCSPYLFTVNVPSSDFYICFVVFLVSCFKPL